MSREKNVALFVLLGALWGGAYPAIKIGLETVPPVVYAAVRYDIASVLMLGYVAYSSEYWRPRTRADWINAGIGGLLIIGAYNAFLFVGETVVPSSIAAILVGLMPILTTVFSRVLLPSESLSLSGIVGVFLGFLGIITISQPDPSNLLTSNVVGQIFVLVAAGSMALGSVLTQRFDSNQPPMTMETWSMLIGAGVLHIAALPSSETVWTVRWTDSAVAMVLYLAVFSSAIAYFIYFHLLEQMGAFEMNFIAYAAAAFGALTGWLVLNEEITAATVGGYGLILGGFLLLKKSEIRQELVGSQMFQTSD